MSRTGRFAHSLLSFGVLNLITVAVGFVATPALLGWLGKEQFGAFKTISEWLSFFMLLEFGLSGAMGPFFSRALVKGNDSDLREALRAGTRAYLFMALCSSVLLLGMSVIITKVVPVSSGSRLDLGAAWVVSIVGILALPLAPYRALLEAAQRSYVVAYCSLLQSLFVTALTLTLAWLGWGIFGQCLATALGSVAFHAAVMALAVRRWPQIGLGQCLGPSDPSVSSQLWAIRTPTLIRQVCFQISMLTDNIIVAWMLGPAVVTSLFTTQRLAAIFQGQLRGIGSACWAPLAEFYHAGNCDLLNTRLVELTRFVAVLGAAGLVPIVVWNQAFLDAWLGPGVFGGHSVTIFAALNAYLLSICTLWNSCLMGAGLVASLVRVSVIAALTNLALSVALTPWVGMSGPLLGTFVSLAGVWIWCLPFVLKDSFGTSPWALGRAVLAPLAWGAAYGLGAWRLSRELPAGNLLVILFEMAVATSGFLLLAWAAILTSSDRAFCVTRLKQSSLANTWRLRFGLVYK